MTNEQRALLSADRRRHLALAKYSNEAYIRELHEAIAEALGAAIDEGEVNPCSSEIRSASPRPASAVKSQKTGHGKRRRRR